MTAYDYSREIRDSEQDYFARDLKRLPVPKKERTTTARPYEIQALSVKVECDDPGVILTVVLNDYELRELIDSLRRQHDNHNS